MSLHPPRWAGGSLGLPARRPSWSAVFVPWYAYLLILAASFVGTGAALVAVIVWIERVQEELEGRH